MELANKATKISLFDVRTPQMRAFHMSWLSFFLCFFGWFGIAPLMPLIRDELGLTKAQIGNTIIASVAITVLARVLIGRLCDYYGARRTYTALLILGSLPILGVGLAQTYEQLLVARLAIGAIGAAFVITQVHTSVMFAPNCVGTANATTAGWGNLGGGVTQMAMPLLVAGILALGVDEAYGWRVAMVVPAVALFAAGIAYYCLTQDAPDGDYVDLRASGALPPADAQEESSFLAAAKDYRVWALFLIYGACFGVELTINNIAALYYFDRFDLSFTAAGLIAGLYGCLNLFSRTLGGYLSDRFARLGGLPGRVWFLGVMLFLEGIALVVFSQMHVLHLAIGSMIVFALFVQMASGATFGVVPFVNKGALGSVAGIVGAGGNAGAVAAGFVFRSETLSTEQGLLALGLVVTATSACTLLVRFSPEAVAEEKRAFEAALPPAEPA